MIKLPLIKQDIIDVFYKKQVVSYKKLLEKNSYNSRYSNINKFFKTDNVLDETKIEKVIIGQVDFLLEAIKCIGKIVKVTGRALEEGDPLFDFCQLYNNFTKRHLGKTLFDDIGVKVCPYCNRSYIHTLRYGGVRPQYDHFFCKTKYPYLAVSIYNLIPSCNVCNQAKSDTDTYDSVRESINFIYPYIDEYGYDIKFKTIYQDDFSYLLGGNTNFKLEIDKLSGHSDLQEKVLVSKKQLKLEELYEKHKDYVLDLIKQCYIYDENYVRDLYVRHPNLFKSIDEIKDLIFMNYEQKDKWGNRILAKLTYDICKEFGN